MTLEHHKQGRWVRSQLAPGTSVVIRAISWMAVAQVLGQITSFVSLIVLGALLSPREFGTVAAGLVLVTVSTLLMGAGTSGSIVSTPNIGPREVRRALLLNLSIGAVLTAIIFIVAEPMTRNFAKGGDPSVLRGLGASLLLYSFSIVPAAILQKRMQFKRYAVAMVAATTISSVTAVVTALLGAGVWALVVRQILYNALLAGLTWWMARDLLAGVGRNSGNEQRPLVPRQDGWLFFLLSAAYLVALNADYLVIGKLTDAAQLGAYSLAFTLSFVPLRQFAWQVGSVFFAASAANPQNVGRQTILALRMTALLLLPVVPPAIVLAPWLLPSVLGEAWIDMVIPFQVLLVVGVGHALLNVIGEFLAGTGKIGFRAWISVAWAVGMVCAAVLFVSAFGIRGAAAAHALVFIPLAAAYIVGGSRRLGLSARQVVRSLCGVIVPVVAQALTTAALLAIMVRSGIHPHISQALGAAVGLGVVILLLLRAEPSPLKEAVSVIGGILARRPPS